MSEDVGRLMVFSGIPRYDCSKSLNYVGQGNGSVLIADAILESRQSCGGNLSGRLTQTLTVVDSLGSFPEGEDSIDVLTPAT